MLGMARTKNRNPTRCCTGRRMADERARNAAAKLEEAMCCLVHLFVMTGGPSHALSSVFLTAFFGEKYSWMRRIQPQAPGS